MFKKRRAVAPYFKTPPPFNPLTGERAPLQRPPAISSMMVVRVASISDDYLTCEGWHPDSHTYLEDLIVAKPFLLRKNPTGPIRFPDYTDTFSSIADGARDVERDDDGETRDFQQKIDPPYFVGELLVAARMEGIIGLEVLKPVMFGSDGWSLPSEVGLPTAMPMDGMEENDKPVFWMDMNVAGRKWSGTSLVATMISASVNEASDVAASDTTFDIDNVKIIAPAGATTYPDGTDTAPTVCNNTLRIPAEDDAGVIAFYNHESELWEGFPQAYTTECP